MIKDIIEHRGLKFGELTISEVISVATEANLTVSAVVIQEAMAVNKLTRQQVLDAVMKSFEHNLHAAEIGTKTGSSFLMGKVGQELSQKDSPKLIGDDFVNRALVYTLGAQVGNHDVGLQPCAGTGDSCPYTGFVKAMQETMDDEEKIAEVTAVILKIGTIYRAGKTTTGCNMEGFGAGSAAIAAAFVELEEGTPAQMERAIALAISPTIANPCTTRVMVSGLCSTHIGGAIMNGKYASSLAMYTTLPVHVTADVMIAMAAKAHLESAKHIVPVVIEYMEAFFKTNEGVEYFIDEEIKEEEKTRKAATVNRAHLEVRELARKANSIIKPFGIAVVGGSSQAVGSPTNTGRIAHKLAKGKVSKVIIELYPELFARRGINVPGILMAAVYGSSTDDGLMYNQVMEKVKNEGIEIEILQLDKAQLQKVTVITDDQSSMVEALNRGGARLVLVDAIPSREEAVLAANDLSIDLVD